MFYIKRAERYTRRAEKLTKEAMELRKTGRNNKKMIKLLEQAKSASDRAERTIRQGILDACSNNI